MEVVFGGLVLLLIIYLLYKLFIDGWLFKVPLFFAGWFGLIIIFRAIGITGVAFRLGENGEGAPVGVAFILSTIICLGVLLTTRVRE
jgi:hypothetical protein